MANSFVKRGQLLFLSSFAVLLVIGTGVLMIPGVCRREISLIDAFFTAVSSVCITGLSVVPLADFSWYGQLLILLMIQCGGVGIMTLSASILLALGRGLSFSDTLLISNLNDNFSLRGTEGLTRTVLHYTLASEAVGFLLIFAGCLLKNEESFFSGMWHSFFVAVSSYCNAGVTPYADSMASQHILSKIGCISLTIFGGLGVYVIYDFLQVWRKRQRQLRVHSLVVIYTTLLLLTGGTLMLYLLSAKGGEHLSWFDCFFLSASSRTAGFQTFNLKLLPEAATTFISFLMLIGGGPGSTAGGMKVSTVAVVAAALWNAFQGNHEVLMFRRQIPQLYVMRAFVIIVIFTLLAGVGSVAAGWLEPALPIRQVSFEAISAISTTGLSIDNTTRQLGNSGKLLIALFMYVGRMGPFTIMLFLLGREKPGQLRYPQERVIIG